MEYYGPYLWPILLHIVYMDKQVEGDWQTQLMGPRNRPLACSDTGASYFELLWEGEVSGYQSDPGSTAKASILMRYVLLPSLLQLNSYSCESSLKSAN